MSGLGNRTKVYTHDDLAELGHRLRKLREEEVLIKREIAEVEAQQRTIVGALPPVADDPENPLRKQLFGLFSAAMQGNDPVMLDKVYTICNTQRAIMQFWRSEYGEAMWVAYQRRMDEIGGIVALHDIVRERGEKAAQRYSIIGCGSREWGIGKRDVIRARFKQLPNTTRLIHGDNGYYDKDGKLIRGADKICDTVARNLGWPPPKAFPYITHLGPAGGPARNKQMLDELIRRRDDDGDTILVIAFHPDVMASKGTFDMISQASAAGVAYEVVRG